MKRQLKRFAKICMLMIVTVGYTSCSDEDGETINNKLFSGEDITSYATIITKAETKEAGIEILKEGNWYLYSGNNSNSINFNKPVIKGTSVGYMELNRNGYQQYCLEWNNGSRAMFAPRQLPIEGQVNFRDLGGYKTKEGRFVKWGKVFRSGKCNKLTESDLSYLASVPLKTVIDFRSNEERESEPDLVPNTVNIQIHYPINPGNLSGVDIGEAIRNGDIEASKQYLVDANEQLVVNFQNEYKAFFADLMEDKTPLMFHCTAGKDRAGFASAMFLASLGVDKETIINDYLLTNTMTGVTIEGMKEMYGDNDMAVCMYYINSVQKEYIEKAFSTIEKNYGSVDNFLVKQLNVDVSKMKELYLY